MSSSNYFRLAAAVFFFRDDDRESIEGAYRDACAHADATSRKHSAISVWRMPRERGAWTPTRTNRGAIEIGERRAAD